LRGVSFLDVNNGFVCGVQGSVWRTTNGGISWTNQPGVAYTMNVIQMLDINNIICCGDGGNIYKTTNGGLNWYPRISNANGVNLNGMSFMDANRGIVVGNLGTVLVTTNGGETWTRTLYQGSGIFRAVSFYSMLRATFVADGGYIYSSADGGNNWLLQQSNIYLSLLAVKFLDNNIGKVVGEQGTCLITNTGGWNTGIKNINSNIPDKYSLNQNYPNPFNPGTKIQFNIKEKGISRIDIYNTSGKLMETLFNTELQPGSYESIWDASNYSSGVYYYRLISKNYSETRKMILVK
ncbi:T9SS C-terminal target domain-containing protein, partial [bacterium]